MGEVGIFDEDDRVELIEGEIVEMTPIGSRHVGHAMRLQRLLHEKVSDEVRVSVQNPLRLGDRSEPEPDIALLEQRADDYLEALPCAEDALLVVEVADTSLEFDRETKIPLYAAHGVPVVWLVNLREEAVEVFENPRDGEYGTRRELGGDERLDLPSPGEGELTPAEIV